MSFAVQLAERATRHAIFLGLAALALAATILNPAFVQPGNLANLIIQSAVLALLAIGQTLVITAGLIDLSVGTLMALATVLICDLMQGDSALTLPAVLLALAVGAGGGVLNGLLYNLLRVHPLILTFGMLSVFHGVILAYTERSTGAASPEILWLANGTLGGVPAILLLVIAMAAVYHHLLARTRFGLHLRAVGGSEEGARRAGVPVARVRLLVYLCSGLSAGVAAIALAGRLGTGNPNAGLGFELDAIVAVVLGGTSLAGGRGTIAGTLAAVLALAIVSNLLNILEISAFWQMVAKGLIIVFAILAYQSRERRP
ncbi:MAG TPA: ABC transporter permease [Kiloniellales bacterium]|nr:ABC transporter permease [Kiloniellales bacterium]